MNVKFSSRNDMIRSVTESVKGMGRHTSPEFSDSEFTHTLKHRTIQSHTSHMGFPVCTYREWNTCKSLSLLLGYAIIAMISIRCGLTYNKVVETIKGIKEVVYTNGTHSTVELTKDQKIMKMMLEKLSIEPWLKGRRDKVQ